MKRNTSKKHQTNITSEKNYAKKSKISSGALVDEATTTTVQKMKNHTKNKIPQKNSNKSKKQSIAFVDLATSAILANNSMMKKNFVPLS